MTAESSCCSHLSSQSRNPKTTAGPEGAPGPSAALSPSGDIPVDTVSLESSEPLQSSSPQPQQHQQQQQSQPRTSAPGREQYDTRYVELQKENQLLNQLIKQYESTLEVVMGKFRTQAQMIQKEKHDLQLKLEHALREERATILQLRGENTALQTHLGTCLNVMRDAVAVDDTNLDMLLTGLVKENEGLRNMLGLGGITDSNSQSPQLPGSDTRMVQAI
ncbi:hypothetical protein DFJ77DRAFT_514149 [Powellomyces hirtus]|nr:hypothetical protein DFJ77DRAFT_514149 [Powellomyces hirtus]